MRLPLLLLALFLESSCAFNAFEAYQCLHSDVRRDLVEYPFPPRHYSSESYFSQEFYWASSNASEDRRSRRQAIEPIFKGNPKTREEIWHRSFGMDELILDESISLVNLLVKVTNKYLQGCVPIIVYDGVIEESSGLLRRFFRDFPLTYIHAKLDANYTLADRKVLEPKDILCRTYFLFLNDIMQSRRVLGPQITNRVVVVSRSSQWKVQEFLSSAASRDIVNLLVVGKSYTMDKSGEAAYVLYTHRLYVDGLGSNKPRLLTSWMNGKLSRPHVDLYPPKLRSFAGHRLAVSSTHQPPFIYKMLSTDPFGNTRITWDGVELRVLQIMSRNMNFSYILLEPSSSNLGIGDAVTEMVSRGHTDIGMGGLYVTKERNEGMEMSVAHSLDCAGFMTLSSRTLPRSRAILGPFQWPVWLCLTLTYMLAIFPLAYSDRLSLSHLWGNFGEAENMFWYVFGTFTNSLTFSGEYSWSSTKKTSTRLLIGVYWVFTIIITACYTGSIIAFVTLPVKPETVDSLDQLKEGFYRIGTYDRGGWERWFMNSSHEKMEYLLKKLEFVRTAEEGVRNVTQAWFFPYAFLASKQELQYIIDTNYTDNKIGRRSALHVSEGCLALFSVAFGYQEHSVYRTRINEVILRMQASGLIDKILRDVIYDYKKAATGKAVAIGLAMSKVKVGSAEERELTLADTEGMFIFLGIGFLIGVGVLISEWVGGCTNRVVSILKKRKHDKDEADRVEAERVEAERVADEGGHRSRKISLFSRRSSGPPKSSGRLTPKSNVSTPSDLSKQALKELYDGPQTKKSTMCFYNNELIDESKLYQAQRTLQITEEILADIETEAKTPPSTASSEGGGGKCQVKVEVNRLPPDNGRASSVDQGVFGDQVLY